MLVVLDTNILVSAPLSPFGPPARVLDLVLTGDLQPVYDDRVMAEYREVLARPRFRFSPTEVSDLLDLVEGNGFSVIARPLGCTLPDPDDLPFLEVATEAGATLVTGNAAHYPAAMRGAVDVLNPAQFVAQYLDQARWT